MHAQLLQLVLLHGSKATEASSPKPQVTLIASQPTFHLWAVTQAQAEVALGFSHTRSVVLPVIFM